MLIFGQDLNNLKENCDFRVTKGTKNFLVGFFGFYTYNISERFEAFILDTGNKDLANHGKIKMEDFVLNGELGIVVNEQYSSKTFDPSIIFPKTFNSEKEAINWLKKQLKESKNLSEHEVCVISVIDGDKLIDFIKEETSIENKKNKAKNKIEEDLKDFKENLLEHYESDKLAIEWINKIPDFL